MIRKVITIVIAAILAFVVAETVTRSVVARAALRSSNVSDMLCPLEGSDRTYGLTPGTRILGYTIDSQGFRSTGPVEKRDGKRLRVISLGDSIAFGMGVRQDANTLTGILQKHLNETMAGIRCEVINAGIPGYNSFQELAYLRETLINYNPDFVILHFCLNDADPVEMEHKHKALLCHPARITRDDLSLRSIVNQSYFLRTIKPKKSS